MQDKSLFATQNELKLPFLPGNIFFALTYTNHYIHLKGGSKIVQKHVVRHFGISGQPS
jgi:hypothetical protein